MKNPAIVAALLLIASQAMAQNQVATLRGASGLAAEGPPPPIARTLNTDLRQVRNYPEQPPIIPHKIEAYQIDLNVNQCMTCHSRTAIEISQAPMISITHFMDREGQFLATASPRRYFCTQCHVPATDSRPLVVNTFVDVDQVIDFVQRQGGGN